MSWQTPKTNWQAGDIPKVADLNRIEVNISELKKAATIGVADAGEHFSDKTVEGALQELVQKVV